MRLFSQVLSLCAYLLLCTTTLKAQQLPPHTDYFGLIAIEEQLKRSKTLLLSTEPNATLKMRQQTLNEPVVQEALSGVRKWLDHPLQLAKPSGMSDDLAFLGAGRLIARTLIIQQYVQLAGGKVRDAIDTTRDTLRLAYALQNHSLIGTLGGVALESLAIQGMYPHLDQLSLPDCQALSQLAQDWASTQGILSFALKREYTLGMEKLKSQIGESNPNYQEIATTVKQMYEDMLALQEKPYLQRKELVLQGDAEAKRGADVLVGIIRPIVLRASDAYTKRLAQARLLFCQSSIRRYRWENHKLPSSLEELRVGDMGIDPFTDMPFKYVVQAATFTLTSAGPFERDSKGTQNRDQRKPF
jgi:hypothetical protein